jgi:hypothetical protein
MNLQLNEEQAALLVRELDNIIENDRYYLSLRIQALREIRAKIGPVSATAVKQEGETDYEGNPGPRGWTGVPKGGITGLRFLYRPLFTKRETVSGGSQVGAS